MKSNNRKRLNLYTQGQQLAARVVLSVGLLFGCCLERALTAPGDQGASGSALNPALYVRVLEPTLMELGNNPALAKLYEQKGHDALRLGNAAEAMGHYQHALEIFKQVHKADLNHSEIAEAWNNLGNASRALGNNCQAVDFLALALQAKFKVSSSPEIANVLVQLGKQSRKMDKGYAVECFKRALAIYEQVYQAAPSQSQIAETLLYLGGVLRALKKAGEAVGYYQRALNIFEEVYKQDANQLDIAVVLNNLGNACLAEERVAEAVGYYQRALNIFEEVNEQEPHYSQEILQIRQNLKEAQTLASTTYTLGDAPHSNIPSTSKNVDMPNPQSSSKPTKSLEELQNALGEAKERCKRANDTDVVKALLAVGDAHKYLGQLEEALEHYQQALDMEKAIRVQLRDYRPMQVLIYLRQQVAELLVELAPTYYDSNPEKAIKSYQKALNKNILTRAKTQEIEEKLQKLCQGS